MKKYEYEELYGESLEDILKDHKRLFPDYRIKQVIRIDIDEYEAVLEKELEDKYKGI